MAEPYQPTTTGPGSSPVSSDPPDSATSFQHDESAAGKSNASDVDRTNGTRTLSDLRDKIADAQEAIKTRYRVVSESTDDYVHEAPWKAVAMALIDGLIIGMLAGR
jgi:ElaB protein